jgi:hypothetical protein
VVRNLRHIHTCIRGDFVLRLPLVCTLWPAVLSCSFRIGIFPDFICTVNTWIFAKSAPNRVLRSLGKHFCYKGITARLYINQSILKAASLHPAHGLSIGSEP